MKREILNFSHKISHNLSKPDCKFSADISYGLPASGSCLLTDVADQLHEVSKKVNTVDRLSSHLALGTPLPALRSYLSLVRKWAPEEPVIHIDDSDIVKSDGFKFEALGIVRDASKSTQTKNVYEKASHPSIPSLSLPWSRTMSSASLQNVSNKWIPATQLRNRRKGKVKLPLFYKGKEHDAYLSHVKVQITASRKDIYLVLVYGITEHPMMLAANKKIRSKEDVIRTAKLYFSRWRIEKYFRCKRQMFQFENFRGRELKAINALNFYITVCMAFLAHISMKSGSNALKAAILKMADPIKPKVSFHYYRYAKGIAGILAYAKEGIRLWFRTKRPAYRQLRLRLTG